MIKRSDIVNLARTWIHTPYLHQGRTRQGIDCAGLVIRIFQDEGLTDYDVNGYSRTPSDAMMRRVLKDICVEVLFDQLKPTDIMHMSFERQPRHLAIVTMINPIRILHADSEAGEVVEHLLDNKWKTRFRGAYRVPGVEDD